MVTMKGEKILLNGHTRRLFWKTNRQIAVEGASAAYTIRLAEINADYDNKRKNIIKRITPLANLIRSKTAKVTTSVQQAIEKDLDAAS